MRFDVDKLKRISRPMTENERREIEEREQNRDWQALSAKFALLLRHILRTERITQTELARRMHVSSGQVSKILSGKENIGLQTIAKVEKALGRSLITFEDRISTNDTSSHDTSSGNDLNDIFSYSSQYKEEEDWVLSCGEPEAE